MRSVGQTFMVAQHSWRSRSRRSQGLKTTAVWWRWIATGVGIALGLLPGVWGAKPLTAAEEVKVSLGALEQSLSLEALQIYAETGNITGDLRFYARFLDAASLAELRRFLQQRFEVDPVLVSQITYAPLGERMLEGLGLVVQTEARQDGFFALRAAMLLAAGDPEGLTVLNIIRRYPSASIRIDAEELLALRQEFTTLVEYRDAALTAIRQQMDVEIAAAPAVDFTQLPNLSQAGRLQVTRRTLQFNRDRQTLTGESIARPFAVDLYLPQGLSQPAPVVVISHGLGSSPAAFAYLAEHLASHGFVAIAPQHIGSDASRREALLSGVVGSDVNPVEFVDRPLDITYVLDQLDRLSQDDPALRGRMDLQNVGAIGHSFGGYTVLALAGADPNIPRLRQECAHPRPTLNAAPVLQCLGDRLPPYNYSLRDPRIKAVFAISPITSVALGPESLSKIQIPTMLMGGSNDFIAATVQEQIHPFIWLTTPDKYLALSIPSGHTFADGTGGGDRNPPTDSIDSLLAGPDPTLGRTYVRALSLAFMQRYLANRPEYSSYLTAAYTQFVQQEPLQLYLVQALTTDQLEQAYGRKPPIPVIPTLQTPQIARRAKPILQEIANTGILRVGVRQNAAPFGSVDENGQPTGFCVDLMSSFAAQLQQQLNRPVRANIVAQSLLDNRFELVRNETVDLECGPNTVLEDVDNIAFSTPFFLTGTQLLVPTANQANVNPLGSLSNVRIGVVGNTTTASFLASRYPDASIVQLGEGLDTSTGIQALANGSIDAFAADGILLRPQANRQELLPSSYSLVPTGPLTCDPYGMLLPVDDPEWQGTVNTFIASPTFRQVWERWFTQELYSYIFLNLDFCVR